MLRSDFTSGEITAGAFCPLPLSCALSCAGAAPARASVARIAPPTLVAIDGAFFTISQKYTKVDVAEAFARAVDQGSFAGSKLSVVELRRIFRGLAKDGFDALEKRQLAEAYAGLFNGAKWNATPQAQKLYAKLQAQYGLPVIPVR